MPPLQEIRLKAKYVDLDRIAVWLGAGFRTPQRYRQIATGTCRGRHQQIGFAEQLEMVARDRRRRFHEIPLIVWHQAGDLENIDDVVNVELGQAEREHRPSEVGMAVEIVGGR